jgi:hypothetical protein
MRDPLPREAGFTRDLWDVETPAGERLQVKARVVPNPKTAGQRQLSVFRSWDFDAAVVVLFDDDFQVWRASKLAVEVLREVARFAGHVSGYRVMATDALLDRGEDWTERLRAATELEPRGARGFGV